MPSRGLWIKQVAEPLFSLKPEFSAAQRLVDAAKLLATEPVRVQLRYLQTLAEIGVEKNTTGTRTLIAHSLDRGPDARSC